MTDQLPSQSNADALADLITDSGIMEREEEDEADVTQTAPKGEGTPDDEEDEEGDESEEAGDSEIVTWSDALGLPEDRLDVDESGKLKGLKIKNPDGTEATVKIRDLIKGYGSKLNNSTESQRLAQERAAYEQERDHIRTQLQTQLEAASRLTAMQYQRLMGDYQSVNWEQLRLTSPGEYLEKLSGFQARDQEIRAAMEELGKQHQGLTSAQSVEAQQRFQQYVGKQVEILTTENPEWKKPEVMKQALTNLQTFTEKTYGFTVDEFNGVADARLIKLATDAMKYRLGLDKAKAQLAKNTPKFQPTGARKPARLPTVLDRKTAEAKATPRSHARTLKEDEAIAELLSGIS